MEYPKLRFWCQKVLPLVYDDSLSYYEVLCKIVDYLNNMIEDNKLVEEDIEELRKEMEDFRKFIDNFDSEVIEQLIAEFITNKIKAVIFGISSAGYFCAYIPETWDNLKFGTIQDGELYGHLTMSYD